LTVVTAVVWLISLGLVVDALRQPGPVRTLRRLAAAAAYACLGVLLGSVLILLAFFHAFSGETLIARVTTRRLSPLEFELTYLPAGAEASPRRIQLKGDQWAVSGGIVKWHPWLTALGLKSYHKPIRLSGQFSNIEQQRANLPTVYPLEPMADRLWEALYWADPYLPFVEAVYGSSAYVYVEPVAVQAIYVTPSGYLIKRTRQR
jgi:hypothetical protein